MKAFEDRSAIRRLSVEPHESSSQPVWKRARDYDYDFAPVAPERLQPAPVTNDYVFAPVAPERLQPAPTRPPVFANWSEDEVEQPKSLPAEVPRMELEDGVEQPKSLPAEVPAVEFEDEVELPKSLWINNEDCRGGARGRGRADRERDPDWCVSTSRFKLAQVYEPYLGGYEPKLAQQLGIARRVGAADACAAPLLL